MLIHQVFALSNETLRTIFDNFILMHHLLHVFFHISQFLIFCVHSLYLTIVGTHATKYGRGNLLKMIIVTSNFNNIDHYQVLGVENLICFLVKLNESHNIGIIVPFTVLYDIIFDNSVHFSLDVPFKIVFQFLNERWS